MSDASDLQQALDFEHTETEQAKHLRRVSAKLEALILSFAKDRHAHKLPFLMVELTNFVGRHGPIAPDSAGRVLRYLRASKQLDYKVINRRQSLYAITSIAESEAA